MSQNKTFHLRNIRAFIPTVTFYTWKNCTINTDFSFIKVTCNEKINLCFNIDTWYSNITKIFHCIVLQNQMSSKRMFCFKIDDFVESCIPTLQNCSTKILSGLKLGFLLLWKWKSRRRVKTWPPVRDLLLTSIQPRFPPRNSMASWNLEVLAPHYSMAARD